MVRIVTFSNKANLRLAGKIDVSVNGVEKKARIFFDTGANQTCFSKQFYNLDELENVHQKTIGIFGAKSNVNECTVDLQLCNSFAIGNLDVILSNQDAEYDILIGMDIISLGEFLVYARNEYLVASLTL